MDDNTPPQKLTRKQRVWLEEYLTTWNATEAARRAGYHYPNRIGSYLLSKLDFYIQQRMQEKAMKADEVLLRLGDIARSDIGEFMDISRMHFSISLEEAKDRGLTKLIKKVRQRTKIDLKNEEETHDIEIELHDALSALVHIGKVHGLFVDRHEFNGNIEQSQVTIFIPENGRDE